MKIPEVRTKDLLTVSDLNREEMINIFKLTTRLKKERKKGRCNRILRKKTLAMIFEKSSTRTRVSFEAGIYQLGGQALFLSSNDIQLGRGETFSDTAKVLSRYVDGIMIRTDDHDKLLSLAKEASIPVINGLTDSYHPCQALTDFFTMYEKSGTLDGLKIAYVGDGNNVANSLLLTAAILGVDIAIASPEKYKPEISIVEEAYHLSSHTGAGITITSDIDEAVKGADYLYTDVWTSMGQEKETARRKKAFAKYRITMDMVRKASPGCMIMHCLPAHRGEEIDGDVIDSSQSIIFDQAENRLHVQKAVMCSLMK